MFNNEIEYFEELIRDEKHLEDIMNNRAERFMAFDPACARPADRVFKQSRVDSLLWAYRDVGYLYANLNPLGEVFVKDFTRLLEYQEHSYHRLDIRDFNLSEEDLELEFFGGKYTGTANMPLRDILRIFNQTYCAHVGAEFLHIQNRIVREWLIERMESTGNVTGFSDERKKIILEDLIKTEEMELMLHRKFIGQKRFSIQGSDVVIPALHFLVDKAHGFGIEEIVIGTSHRGRLSILNQILNLTPSEIFYLFEENFMPGVPGGGGDVRYHIGFCNRHRNEDGTSVNITLLPNSSHLESVNAIVEGNARGLQDRKNDTSRTTVMPVLIHGDASFSGQGVVAETFNLSQLADYTTGGTVHIVINNQIGFTTSSLRGHSGLNPTDVAKTVEVPIFHVNGDDPEAVLHTLLIALEFRQNFHQDVVIDIICYRRFGHNEGDEPSYTQPFMYSLIEDHESVTSQYLNQCIEQNIVESGEIDALRKSYRQSLEKALETERAKHGGVTPLKPGAVEWPDRVESETAVPAEILSEIAGKLFVIPDELNVHPRLKRIVEGNYKRFFNEGLVDWSMAESMAFGSLLTEGASVRLSGQDSERGTFSQRHLVWWEKEKEDCCHYIPLSMLSPEQGRLSICNSPLSEYSVLGFEYGYAMVRTDALVLWEAQYGDFVNGAQIVIDNYIIAARSKWNVKNGLVILLPHGFEGMGPEHSNAHLERFLQLCAEDNIRVCNVTTPAQYFHLLRGQKKRIFAAPLIIMTQKSMLRLSQSFSASKLLTVGKFNRILVDEASENIDRILMCSGKIYYELKAAMEERSIKNITIIRFEQLYPFPLEEISTTLLKHGTVKELCWVQEEPKNRGAWTYIRGVFDDHFPGMRITYMGRDASASPATGSLVKHNEEQRALVDRAITAKNSG